jgi:hypothetical protein
MSDTAATNSVQAPGHGTAQDLPPNWTRKPPNWIRWCTLRALKYPAFMSGLLGIVDALSKKTPSELLWTIFALDGVNHGTRADFDTWYARQNYDMDDADNLRAEDGEPDFLDDLVEAIGRYGQYLERNRAPEPDPDPGDGSLVEF